MPVLIVTSHPDDWPFEIPGVDKIDAWTYLTSPETLDQAGKTRATRVFNLCRSYRYQSLGYYVSLLAEARGHKPLPGVITVQDLKSRGVSRLIPDEVDEILQQSLSSLTSDDFTLSIYFGRNFAKRYERLAQHLFNLFPVPLMKFELNRRDGRWQIRRVAAVAGSEVPESHREFVAESATRYFSRRASVKSPRRTRFDMAILTNPAELHNAPSDPTALKKFIKAAREQSVYAELITRDDSGRLLEFDSLFIRETTAINHHTYRFSRRAASEGLVVIDDPVSICRCTNKVFLAEMMTRQKVDIPKSIVVHRDNAGQIGEQLGFPCVLKKPDSSFSMGVVKVHSSEELKSRLDEFFGESDLLLAQEYLPTTFDWRIGILDRKPLFACRYYMAPGHWQIIRQETHGSGRYGKVETLPVELAPAKAVKSALKAANLIGDGLYGVDVKESNGRFVVIEVNDNPNINAGVEDAVLKDELYRRIVEVFVRRMEHKRARYDVA
ncbi:MAG: RimK family protein [Planctomycetaceae bacterium]|nr:RimK family protein [Planctomycetaceae bacterium]